MRSLLVRLAAFAATPLLALAAPSALDNVIALPEFKVFDDRPLPAPEKWDYARVGNFEILSNTSPRVTKQFVKDLTDFQIILGIIAPSMLIRAEQPVMVVLCGRDNAFEKFEVKPMIRSTRGRGTSLVRDNEIASIVVDYQTRYIDDVSWASFPAAQGNSLFGWSGQQEIFPTEEFIRQYIHLSLSQLSPRPPAWVAEGLANIYGSIDYNNKWIEIGKPRAFIQEIYSNNSFGGSFSNSFPAITSSYPGAESSYSSTGFSSNSGFPSTSGSFGGTYVTQAPLAIMPMEKMFGITYDSPLLRGTASREDYVLNNWQRQTTAFVHLCLYGQHGKYRQAFLKFAERTATEPATEALFKECFGVSYKDMGFIIRGYTEFTDYTGKVIEAKSGGILYPRAPVAIRPANDAEIGRIKGETFRLAGQDESARREFVVAYLRGERDPQLLASLGLMARQRKDDARARTYLEAVGAAPAPVPRPRAYLELARLRAAAQSAQVGPQPLTTEQLVELLTPLFVAQRLPQQLVSIYLEIAGVWERSAVPPGKENLGALEYGVRVFPNHGELILRTASLLVKHGYKADAAPLIQRALHATRDPELKARLELLRQKIDATPVTRAAPLFRFSPEAQLGPELLQRLTDYRSARTRALHTLRAQLEAAAQLPPALRGPTLGAFAAVQTPTLRSLENDASRLESDLGWPPDQSDDFAPGLTELGAGQNSPLGAHADILLAALRRPQGLSPPQTGLLREMIQELHDDAASRGAFSFFGPATARVRWPASLPPELTAQLAACARERDALKTELRTTLVANVALDTDFARTVGLSALAEQQAPRFAALQAQTESIRQALALLPARSTPGAPPALSAPLAARLAAYQSNRAALQQSSRRTLLTLRSQLPSGGEIITAGNPPRLVLQPPAGLPDPSALRTALDTFNADYATRSATLTRELAELRRLLASAAPGGDKSVDDLMQEFSGALARQTAPELYRDCYAAVFQPGLTIEQRRLLFARAGEKSPALILEF